MKNNLEYYQHYANSHDHAKFKMLRVKYGWEGEGKFWALNNLIARADNCILDLSKKYNKASIAIDLDFSLEEFDKFIEYLANECNLLILEENTITTDIVQENLEKVMVDRERAANRRRPSADKHQKIADKPEKTANENHKVKESKVKESKVNIVPPDGDTQPPELDNESWEYKEAEKWKKHITNYFKSIKIDMVEWVKCLTDLQGLDNIARDQIESIRKYLEWEAANSGSGFRWCDQIRGPCKLRKRKFKGEPQYWEKVLNEIKKVQNGRNGNTNRPLATNRPTETRKIKL